MKIVKCPKCGKYLHKAPRCLFCGNTSGFQELPEEIIHKNIATDYAHVNYLVESKKFDEAMELSYAVIEWMPDLAEIFWLRLLAKNKCVSDAELILKGFDSVQDSDYCNALRFSKGEVRQVYSGIGDIVKLLRQSIKSELASHEIKKKSQTDILIIKKTFQGDIEERKNKLFGLWSDLEEIEQALYALEMDCRTLSREHIISLEQAAQDASLLKNQVYKLDECTAESLNSYQVKIGTILQQSEQAKAALMDIKNQHPWVKEHKELTTKRDKQVNLIATELKSLRDYEATVNRTLTEIDRIEKSYKEAIIATDKYDFAKAFSLLESDITNMLLQSVGVDVSSLYNRYI